MANTNVKVNELLTTSVLGGFEDLLNSEPEKALKEMPEGCYKFKLTALELINTHNENGDRYIKFNGLVNENAVYFMQKVLGTTTSTLQFVAPILDQANVKTLGELQETLQNKPVTLKLVNHMVKGYMNWDARASLYDQLVKQA